MCVLGKMPGTVRVFVIAHPVCKALSSEAVIRQIEVVVIDGAQMRATLFGQDDVVETDAVALRIDVQFSDGIGLIAAAAKCLRQGR